MPRCAFASDLHGREDMYEKLFAALLADPPDAVFLGGDLLPGLRGGGSRAFEDVLLDGLEALRRDLGPRYPRVFAIPGNDDPAAAFAPMLVLESEGLLEIIHRERAELDGRAVFGYACTPPSPFILKDFERYDVSRYVDPGCVSPEEGVRTIEADESDVRYGTIAGDLDALAGEEDLSGAVFLFHAPPYQSALDRAALDGKAIDGVPLDVHIGSIAVRRFIEAREPLVTLHGHVHESARLSGQWRDRIGRTHAFSAAHDGPELALVRFDLDDLENAERVLV